MGRAALKDYSDNFWYQKWKESGYTSDEIGKKLGVSGAALRNWIYGKYFPSDDMIRKVCDIFDVDMKKGKEEFVRFYCNRHNATVYVVPEPTDDVSKIPEKIILSMSADTEEPNYDTTNKKFNVSDVMRLLYGKVDFSTYKQVEYLLENA